MRIFVVGVLAVGLCVGETVEFKALTPGVLEERLKLAHPKSAERFLRLRGLFTETGCKDLREQKVKGSKEPNLICAVETDAPDARRIIVGAHVDSAGGTGIIDNWTGAILLPSLAEFIAEKPRRHSLDRQGSAFPDTPAFPA